MGILEDIVNPNRPAQPPATQDDMNNWLRDRKASIPIKEPSFLDRMVQGIKDDAKKPFLEQAMQTAKDTAMLPIGAAESAALLAGGAAMFPINQMFKTGYWPGATVSDKLAGVTRSPDEIAAEANKVVGAMNEFMIPAPQTKVAKTVMPIAEKIIGAITKPAHMAKEFLDEKDVSPYLSETAQFALEIATFKGLHLAGTGISKSVRTIRAEIKKGKADSIKSQKALDDILDKVDAKLDIPKAKKKDRKTPEAYQAYVEKITKMRQDFMDKNFPGSGMDEMMQKRWKVADINKDRAAQNQRLMQDIAKPKTFDITPDMKSQAHLPISGEKTTAEINLESAKQRRQAADIIKKVQPEQARSAIEKANEIRRDIGLKPYEIRERQPVRDAGPALENIARIKEDLAPKSKEKIEVKIEEPVKSDLRDGDKAAAEIQKIMPEHQIEFDSVWDPGSGFPIKYQFTPKAGPFEGRTFNSSTLASADVIESFKNLKGVRESLESAAEKPLVQKTNVADIKSPIIDIPKPKQSSATPIDLDRLPDWVEAELESIYKDPKAPKRISTIAKQVLETGEITTPGMVKSFKTWYEKVKKQTEDMPIAKDLATVDPEIGRRPGGFDAPEPAIYKSEFQARSDMLHEYGPIRNSKGKIISNKMMAQAYMDESGVNGKLVKSGEGWRVRKSKAEKEKFDREIREDYERQLREEGLEEIEPGSTEKTLDIFDIINNESGSINFDLREFGQGLLRIIKNNRGELKISKGDADKIKALFQSGEYKAKDLARGLRAKGASEKQIKDLFQKTSVQKINQGTSKWLKKGDDPNELLKARKRKGRDMPALTREEANTIANAKDIGGRLWNEDWSIETGDKSFHRITDINGPGIEDMFYWEAKKADTAAAHAWKQEKKFSKRLQKGMSGKSQRRVGTYAHAKQEGGELILEQMGLTEIPKLTEKEMYVYDTLREKYRNFYDEVNEARVRAGEERFPAVDNYFTWLNDMDWLLQEHGIGMDANWQSIASKLQTRQVTPSFRFAKHRGGDIPRKLELNPFTMYETYAKTALNTIHKAEPLAKMNEMLLSKYGLYDNAPNMHTFLSAWRESVAGKPHIFNTANPKSMKALRHFNNSVVAGLLSFTAHSAIIQPTALAASFVELNHHLITGLVKTLNPKEYKRAHETSNTLATRSPDVSIHESMDGLGKLGKIGKLNKDIGRVGYIPLSVLDNLAATATWLGAEAKAIKLKKSDSTKYADTIVDQTQASAAMTNRAPIQRHILGQTITGLQTFVINHWGWLTREVMGVGKLDQNNPESMAKVIKFVAASAVISSLCEDSIGIMSPFGTPIRSAAEVKEDGGNDYQAVAAAAKELIEYVPIYGGTIKYDTQLGGPLINTLWDIKTSAETLINKQNPTDEDIVRFTTNITKLAGIPGSNQFFKSYRAYAREGNAVDIILGRYVEKPEKGYGRSSREPRSPR